MNPNYFDPDQRYDLKNDPQDKQNLFEAYPDYLLSRADLMGKW